ncbi:MAG: hypothetical protein KF888_12270, partial [Nitrosomonas sp.]|nr:hypothetical protein [Nitrosomonas sp.]
MTNKRFKITLKGDEANNSLRLGDLIDQLDALKNVLNHIDKRISDRKSPSLYYRITELSMNSPVTMEVEAVSKQKNDDHGSAVIKRFSDDLLQVIKGKRPYNADLELLESYKSLAKPLKKHILQFVLSVESQDIDIPRSLDSMIEDILGPDQIEYGSIVGSLDVIDIHNDRNNFKVYPMVGATCVKCHFKSDVLHKALSGINHFVEITGELHYKKAEKFPHFINVANIDILPDDSEIRHLLSSIRGIAKDNFLGISSTEYVDSI